MLTLFIGTLEAADTSTEKYDESSTVAEVVNVEQQGAQTTKLRSINTNLLPAKRAELILHTTDSSKKVSSEISSDDSKK